ncbi:L-serine ammonia-lyase [Diaphorobacter sp. HDW4A]|uniref:L-serine ammonia-lyase n=1 Tax=Diaphorobacter sp. HDW4A TaxID=2714924 RepID=UPI00140E327B|nr:L-serine ammonia-lyase [Diaphorobacter sp. HDW4A]QIL82678.1 L-serine ammonia-lyase [Diaphorobacter sp. HDW4A]
MAVSVFDLFKIGIGPSSSHTVGPMRAARQFVQRLARNEPLSRVARLRSVLYGSLGATGRGHASDRAVMLGLAGFAPDTVDVDAIDGFIAQVRRDHQLPLAEGGPLIPFKEGEDLVLDPMVTLPFHANGMRFEAWDAAGDLLDTQVYYSVGGGFIVSEEAASDTQRQAEIAPDTEVLPLPFHSGEQLLLQARAHGGSIANVMRVNERHWRGDVEIDSGLLVIWQAMQACVERGCGTAGELPGGFRVRRRAPALHKALVSAPDVNDDPLQVIDWVNLFALAVNEENAAGGRVVTAPTNGAAGIVPAVLHYYTRFIKGADERGVVDFLLTAGAIGILYKENASISGAEVGCQGEVGVACSMAAAGLCAVLGGTPEQVENAAEIGMEHHLGLTCDPVGGLVQIPCIERNALAAVKAINAARMALRGDGTHHVSLDQVIKTMRETGADMMTKYKETSRGGLAVNIVEC